MATIRLTATVSTAVSASTRASERVARSTDQTLDGSTIRTAVTISTAARAASGIRATRDDGSERCTSGRPIIIAATMPTRASDSTVGCPAQPRTDRHAASAVLPDGLATPRTAGTCSRKMMTAMPRANPSTTGHGT